MKSEITSNPVRSALVELVDLLFVPSSFLRFAHTRSKEEDYRSKEQDKDSKFCQAYSKVYPYLSASFLECFRLYGYYKLGEGFIKKLS